MADNKWRILTAVLIGTIMGPLDASVVYIAMPAIAQVFEVEPALVGWVSISYLLVLGSFLLSFGRLGDIFGFKKIYLRGLLLFVVTSALCGVAVNLQTLIVFRVLQAVGAGMIMAMGPAIVTAAFPPTERGKALGLIGMAVAVGLALGPSLGGLLTEWVGWRAIFFLNIPVGTAAYLWGWRVLSEFSGTARQRFDGLGSLLAFISLATLLFAVSRGGEMGWSWQFFILLGLGIISGALFILFEKKCPEPMLDLNLFRSSVFSAGNGAALLNFMTQYVIVFLTPFFLQRVLGYSPGQAGAVMTAFPFTVLVIAPLAGALSDRIGQRGPALLGSFICTVAAVGFSRLGDQATALEVAWRLSLFGLGTGIFQSPNNSAVLGAAPKNRTGIASGVLATTRNVGMVLGIALGGAVLANREAFYLANSYFHPFLLGLKDAYSAAALVSGLGTGICFFMTPQKKDLSSSVSQPDRRGVSR
ncbi:MAG: DHA2 family efflux MFS transporter permease subunit [Bacillota bacterium]|jgi:EmrB/QacA subfamily drug resistance transporter|nr:DHA2 family efflux MFS transporter permease subunit [Bacillota bacterium]